MLNYLTLMRKILKEGEQRDDRTGVGTYSLFGEQLRFDLTAGFPAVTTKRLWFHGVREELAWMLRGETNIKSLQEAGVHIWDKWADSKGELGPVYGAQWRGWADYGQGEAHIKDGNMIITPAVFDQVDYLIDQLIDDPTGRRHILSAWNVNELPYMKLPPCHVMAQFYVTEQGGLKCHMFQRSCDFFLGGPFNIAQYALLTHCLAEMAYLTADELVISYGDVHIYKNHVAACEEQLGREPFPLPTLVLDPGTPRKIIELLAKSATLKDYQHHPTIKADIAV